MTDLTELQAAAERRRQHRSYIHAADSPYFDASSTSRWPFTRQHDVDAGNLADYALSLIATQRAAEEEEIAIHPKLTRGRVWCTVCGATQPVDSQKCLATGWPKCCGGLTMTIDSPEERKAFKNGKATSQA